MLLNLVEKIDEYVTKNSSLLILIQEQIDNVGETIMSHC